MAKNIIVCSDGTGDTAIKGHETNVFKLYESLDLTHHHLDPRLKPQIAFYDYGVGTQRYSRASGTACNRTGKVAQAGAVECEGGSCVETTDRLRHIHNFEGECLYP
jgi:hypothetical protein